MKKYLLTSSLVLVLGFSASANAETLFSCDTLSGYSYYFSEFEFYNKEFVEDSYSAYRIELQRIGNAYEILRNGASLLNEGWELSVGNVSEDQIFITLHKPLQEEHYHFTIEGDKKQLIWTSHQHGRSYSKGSLMVADCK